MLDQITPLILTYNESPNIGRVLERLTWARDIVVVDSFSDDDTLEIVSRFSQARVFQRKFDKHERQWNFGLKETGIKSEWIMALDADFILTPEAIREIQHLQPAPDVTAFRAPFTFCINGRKLRSSLCPPVTFLYRRERAEYLMDGHTQKLKLDGRVDTLRTPILHDDRKPFGRWVMSQQAYAALESKKLLTLDPNELSLADRIRRLRVVAPLVVPLYCLVICGGILDGWAGIYYSFQRMFAELLLSLNLLENDLKLGQKQQIETVVDDEQRRVPSRLQTDSE